jgi:hypothetical protein
MATKPSMSINLGLPVVPEVEDPILYNALAPLYNAIRNVMYAVDSYTGNGQLGQAEYAQVNAFGYMTLQKQSIIMAKASVDMGAGTMVGFFDSGSGLEIRKAILPTYSAQGFTIESVTAGQHTPVCLMGLCSNIGGLTTGVYYYMSSATAGLITPTATAQRVGFALGDSKLFFNPD